MKRRNLLIGGGLAVAWVIGAPKLIRLTQPEFAFSDVPGLPGFRSLGFGRGGANIALLGIDDSKFEPLAQPCNAIFGDDSGDPRLPVAVFTDYYCPYCPAVSDVVRGLDRAGVLRAVWREWPVLGPRSEALARVALAAAEQGAHDAAHQHLMRAGLRPGPAALNDLAAQLGLDPGRLSDDASSDRVTARIEATRRLAKQLGLPGTPGLAIARTLTAGAISEDRLRRLVTLEHDRGACTG